MLPQLAGRAGGALLAASRLPFSPFFPQLIEDKKVLSERCEAVVAELKQADQKYSKKISQMQEQHELVR